MRRCCNCESTDVDEHWKCASCGWQPRSVNGIAAFSGPTDEETIGFQPESFELLAAIEPDDFWFIARNEIISSTIQRWSPNSQSMFEVGCGTGFVLRTLRDRLSIPRIVGSELFAEGLDIAKQRLGKSAELYQLDAATHRPFIDEFDVVGCFDVLEHIPDDVSAMQGLADAAIPGGVVVVTVPQHQRLWSVADDFGHHQRRYSKHELLEKLRGVGLRPVYVTSFVTLLLPLMFLSRWTGRNTSVEEFSPAVEHARAKRLSRMLTIVMNLERWLIRRGIRLPVGGSILVVCRKCTPSGD